MQRNKDQNPQHQFEFEELKRDLNSKDEEIQSLKKLNSQYWEQIQSMRLSHRLKRGLGLFEWQKIKNKWACNNPFESEGENNLRIAIKMPAPNWFVANTWGDYYFSISLKKALVKLGYDVTIQIVSEWYNDQSKFDVVIVLRGPVEYKPDSSHLNLMWNISHPKMVPMGEYEEYDHVFVASMVYTEELKKTLRGKVSILLQCTDPDIFYPVSGKKNNRILFIGNSHGQFRPMVKQAIEAHYDLDVYGKDWEGIIENKYIKKTFVANSRVKRYYSKYKIILNDHWEDMRDLGFVSNRIFDVLACEGLLISDDVKGIPEDINPFVHTYTSHQELACKIEDLKNSQNPKSSQIIADNHSFDQRGLVIDKKIKELLKKAEKLNE